MQKKKLLFEAFLDELSAVNTEFKCVNCTIIDFLKRITDYNRVLENKSKVSFMYKKANTIKSF